MNKENTDGIRELIGDLKQEAVEEYKKENGIGWIRCSERISEKKVELMWDKILLLIRWRSRVVRALSVKRYESMCLELSGVGGNRVSSCFGLVGQGKEALHFIFD